jgi:hypothetical protein
MKVVQYRVVFLLGEDGDAQYAFVSDLRYVATG